MGTQATTDSEPVSDIRALDDPEFFRHWSALRQRVALSGKTMPARTGKRKPLAHCARQGLSSCLAF